MIKAHSKSLSTVLHNLGFRRRHFGLPIVRPITRALTKSGILSRQFVLGPEIHQQFTVRVGDLRFNYVLDGKDPIGSVLYWQSWREWEPAVVRAFRTWLPGTRRVLDIGANTGFYTLLSAANGSEVSAYEPNPTTFSKLEQNVLLNHFEAKCKLFQVATGSRSTEIRLYLHDDPTCCSPVLPAQNWITVQSARIDVLVPLDQITDLVKMDVEGYEDEALYGMEGVIRDSHPKIIFECFRRSTAPTVEALLKDHGYGLMWIAPDGTLVPIERIAVEKYQHGQHNFAACV